MSSASFVPLPDGRRLAYNETGATSGRPVLLLHGAPGSRLQRHPNDSLAERAGVRLVTVDRPGYGLSTHAPGRTLLDWPRDLVHLTGALGIERFSLVGISGGGVFALACAAALGERISRLTLVSTPAPLTAPGVRASLPAAQRLQLQVAARAPWLTRLMFGAYTRSARRLTPAAIRQRLALELPPDEVRHLSEPGFVEMLLADAREAGRQGAAAIALELALVTRPWNLPLEKVRAPVKLLQGEADNTVTPTMLQWLAGELPGASSTLVPGAGHLLGFSKWEEILKGA